MRALVSICVHVAASNVFVVPSVSVQTLAGCCVGSSIRRRDVVRRAPLSLQLSSVQRHRTAIACSRKQCRLQGISCRASPLVPASPDAQKPSSCGALLFLSAPPVPPLNRQHSTHITMGAYISKATEAVTGSKDPKKVRWERGAVV